MNIILSIISVSCLIREYAAVDLQNIQNANPLNVDLSNPSETGIINNGDAEIDEHKLGGYRPLYPPYFLRDTPNQQPAKTTPQQAYYDKEYYTRGTKYNNGFDDRLNRGIRFNPAAINPAAVNIPVVTPRSIFPPTDQRQVYARAFPTFYSYKTKFENHAAVHSSYSYKYSFKFPNT